MRIFILLFSFCIPFFAQAQLQLKPKVADAFLGVNVFFQPGILEDGDIPGIEPYNETYLSVQAGYYLTRRVAVGLHYVNIRGGRSPWPDSSYHIAGAFQQFALQGKTRFSVDAKFLQAIGNLCPCLINGAYEERDQYRVDKLLFYLGWEASLNYRIHKSLHAKLGIQQLKPLNANVLRTVSIATGTVGLFYEFPAKSSMN